MTAELGEGDSLIVAARHARDLAYAPYSKFTVGAAVSTGSGRVFTGANVENASYGLTVCAERVAIFAAIAAGERIIRELAVVTSSTTVTPPCGACRQVIVEFGPEATIYGGNLLGKRRSWSAQGLLPDAFGPASLGDSEPDV